MSETVVLTGVTGFIAKHIALVLLNRGVTVRASMRNLSRADEVRDALRPGLTDAGTLDRLSFVELDLTGDDGWTGAMAGAQALVHTASPFPMAAPKNEADVIGPAVDGTLRALRAAEAAGVSRVVITSSVVAIEGTPKHGGQPFTEDDWTDPETPGIGAYYKSKTLAERATWDFARAHPGMQVTAINPALVLGRPLDARYGTSLELIERILRAKDPALPNLAFGIVDVEEVAEAHVAALERPETAGKRYILCAATRSMLEIARHIADRYPDRKIVTREAPMLLLRLLSLFDASVKGILPRIGLRPEFDHSRAESELGIAFRPWTESVGRSCDAILAKT